MGSPTTVKLRLYVAGDAPNATQAIANLTAICTESLPGGHEIELVDVLREPERSLADGILMTPTLLRVAPLPLIKIVGTLSEKNRVLQALGLERSTP